MGPFHDNKGFQLQYPKGAGDTYFPEIDYKLWKEASRDERFKDDKHKFVFTFIRYNKK